MSQEIIKIEVGIRDHYGTGSARALRRSGMIPAVVYGKNRESIGLTLSNKEFLHKFKSGSLSAHLIQMNIIDKMEFVLLREIQRHPVSGVIWHVDFQFVNTKQEIKVEVPLLIINEQTCQGLKMGGILSILHSTIPVKCFPDNIPQSIDVDIADISIGDSIHAKDLSLPNGTTAVFKEDNATIITISSASNDESGKISTEEGETTS